MTVTTLKKAIVAQPIKTSFKFLPNALVEIVLEGSQSYFKGYGKVLDKPHVLGYERIMLDNGEIIFLDRINETLLEFPKDVLEDYDFTEVYQSVFSA